LRQSGTFRANQKVEERMMDSMHLERECADNSSAFSNK